MRGLAGVSVSLLRHCAKESVDKIPSITQQKIEMFKTDKNKPLYSHTWMVGDQLH